MFRRVGAVCLVAFVIGGFIAVRGASKDASAPAGSGVPAALPVEASGDAQTPTPPPREVWPAEEAPAATPEPEWVQPRPEEPDLATAFAASRAAKTVKIHPNLVAAATDGVPGFMTDRYVPVSALAERSGVELLEELRGLGLVEGLAQAKTVSGRIPASNLSAANGVESLRYMRPQLTFRSTGEVVSQGDKALRADIGREKFDVTGKGVTVGIVSDSFDCLESAHEDVATGDLPAKVTVLKEGECGFGIDEGRAMAQIIADVAPEATLKFSAAGESPAAMAKSIAALVKAGADVIVDDIGFIDEPWLQDGTVARAVDAAEDAGVAYFSSAGNSGHASYEGAFDTAGVLEEVPEIRLHDFDDGKGVDPFQRVTVGPMSFAIIGMQWSDNFKTQVPAGPAPKSDLAMVAFATDGLPLAIGDMPNLTSLEPFEWLVIPNESASPLPVDLGIFLVEGRAPAFLQWTLMQGKVRVDQHATSGATITGHSQANGTISVGSAGFKNTPAFGKTPPLLRSYSSRGSTPIVFDKNGRLLKKGLKRIKPEIVAPDGANTTFFGVDTSDDADKWPNFLGTSAAAPHAAGVAALLLERVPKAKPTDVCNALASTATEMGKKGFDFDSGHGLVDASAALGWLTKTGKDGPCPAVPIEIPIADPEPDPPALPKPPTEPEPSAAPVAPATPSAPPTPRPVPPSPHLFVDEREVTAGNVIHVSGWDMPRHTRFDISLNGEQIIGSDQTNARGRLSATLRVPQTTKEGKYVVGARAGDRRFAAARSILVHENKVIRRSASSPHPIALTESREGLPINAAVIVLLALFVGFLLFIRRWQWP